MSPRLPTRTVEITLEANSILAVLAVTAAATLLHKAGFPTQRRGLASSATVTVAPGTTVEVPLPGTGAIALRATRDGVEIDAPMIAGLVATFGPSTTLADGRARWTLRPGKWGPTQITVDGTTLSLLVEVL